MRFCTFREYGALATGFVNDDRAGDARVVIEGASPRGDAGEARVIPLDDLNDALGADFGPDLDEMLRRQQVDAFRAAVRSARLPTSGWKPENLRYAPPIARPGKVWGVGLNFEAHARDLGASRGDTPGAWMRPASTLAGAGDAVTLPEDVGRVTAEAEIAVVLGRRARRLDSRKEALEAIFGFMPVLDLTAEDLVRQNPRLVTQAKSYDGFCVVGPFVTTADAWEPTPETVIRTVVDGERKEGTVAQMLRDPLELVRHFSHVFAWEPGDVLLTGTPGALPLRPGSVMRAEIDGLPPLEARVAARPPERSS